MATKADKTETSVTQFPINVREYLNQVSNKVVETKGAFEKQMQKDGKGSIRLAKEEWEKLFAMFRTKPVGVNWKDWTNLKGA